MGRSGPPAPSVSASDPINILGLRYPPISEFQTVWIHILIIFFAGPGQFTKRLLIISADAKGKDSMILFKIKETAHINSGHVLFYSLVSQVMMALTQENVHYTLNIGQGVMNKSNRVHARIQEFLSGGGGGGGRVSRPVGQKTVWTMLVLVIKLFYNLQSGSNGFITEGRRGSNFFQGVGVSKETHITCDFPGGSGPPNPPLDPHVGSPGATLCLQNHGLSKFTQNWKIPANDD